MLYMVYGKVCFWLLLYCMCEKSWIKVYGFIVSCAMFQQFASSDVMSADYSVDKYLGVWHYKESRLPDFVNLPLISAWD